MMLRSNRFRLLALVIAVFCGPLLHAQTFPVVMLSDLHFDPLHDPGKVAKLAAAPVAGWNAILEAPDSADQVQAFAALQGPCKTRGEDASFGLLRAALDRATMQSPGARFVTVSGDLLVHNFECRYKAVMKTDDGFADFAEKTTNYVIGRVEAAFPRVPVYVALGNNDSSCGDYRMNLSDRYLKATSDAVLHGLRGVQAADLQRARASYVRAGYFAVPLAGVAHARMIVIDDIYLSRKYQTCGGKDDEAGAQEVLAWLRGQLAEAKRAGERVWLVAHIPPGIDVYSTVEKQRKICEGKAPEIFLGDESLVNLLERYGSTVRLGIFGHTHSDEVRLLGQVPIKIVGSVTTIHGNVPSFTVGTVDARQAQLEDYSVFVAADKSGAGPWNEEYSFRKAYGVADFSAASLGTVIRGFSSDPGAQKPASQAYQRDFFPGSQSPLGLVWPQAVCSLDHITADQYRSCVCRAQPGN